jgi:drug/metabolite transporter (DMT)-like permease
LTFAALRFLAAAPLLFGLASIQAGPPTPIHAVAGRAVASGLLGITVAYALVFWGLARTPSGVAGLINLSLMPVGLFLAGWLAGIEAPSRRRLVALAIGAAGLALLMAPTGGDPVGDPVGLAAIVIGTLLVGAGNVVGRPLVAAIGAIRVNAWTSLIGGMGLGTLALVIEPVASVMPALTTWPVLGALAYLVLAGSLVAYTAFWRLLRLWGPARSGSYAYVSPVVALVVGWVVLDEPLGWREVAATVILIAAAWLALTALGGTRGDSARSP